MPATRSAPICGAGGRATTRPDAGEQARASAQHAAAELSASVAALHAVQRWASQRIRAHASAGAARLAPLAELCEKLDEAARSVETYNLDRRPFIVSMFGDLAEAVRLG